MANSNLEDTTMNEDSTRRIYIDYNDEESKHNNIDEQFGDRSPRERSPREKSPRERSPRERSPKERSPKERSSRDRSPRDISPRDRSPRDIDRSPRNDYHDGLANSEMYDKQERRGNNRDENAPEGCSLLVRNLRFETTANRVRRHFERFGNVNDVYLPLDYYSRRPRGFGFVEFSDPRDADDAVRNLDGSVLDGNTIRVVIAHDRRKSPETMRRIQRDTHPKGPRSGPYARYDRYPPPGDYRGGRYRGDFYGKPPPSRYPPSYRGGGYSRDRRPYSRSRSRSPIRDTSRSRSPPKQKSQSRERSNSINNTTVNQKNYRY